MVSLTGARANALIGVFISVTTIPAAASVGVSIAYSSWSEAGVDLPLLLNVVLLVVVARPTSARAQELALALGQVLTPITGLTAEASREPQ